MSFTYVSETDLDEIRACVDCSVNNAISHEDSLGTTDADKDHSTNSISKQMKQSLHDGRRYIQLISSKDYDAGNGPGRVALFFHRMKWMSAYGIRTDGTFFKDVWVLTVSFSNDILPPKAGIEAPFRTFVSDLTSDRGPLRNFLRSHPQPDGSDLTSLFIVGPVAPAAPADPDKKRLGRLERLAKGMAASPANSWKIKGTTTIKAGYKGKDSGGADVPVPLYIRQYWGMYTGNKFDLTELDFS